MTAAQAALPAHGASHGQPHSHAAGLSEHEAHAFSQRIVVAYGFWIFLISDIILFSAFFATYAVLSDSTLARSVSFGAPKSTTTDPRAAALVAERSELEAQVATLRGRKDKMTPAAYEAELERLLVQVAQKTQAIRALSGGTKP